MADKKQTFRDFADQVEAEGDLKTFTLGDLRAALGFSKLGPRVLRSIDEALAGAGLGFFPRAVLEDSDSPRASDVLRVYRKGSPLGSVVDAVLWPTSTGDDTLRDVVDDDAKTTLASIRALVEA